MTKVAFFNDGSRMAQVYAQGRSETILKQFNAYPKIIVNVPSSVMMEQSF